MDRHGRELQSLETLDVRRLASTSGEAAPTGKSRLWQVVASSATLNLPRADHASLFVEFPDDALV